jgi:DNA-binding MarR family transcriptional regulator
MTRHSSGKDRGKPLPLGARINRIAGNLLDSPFIGSPLSGEAVGKMVRARRLRHRYFPNMLFGEPAWDMLLELLEAETEGRQATLTTLCEAAGIPATIARRWLNSLTAEGLVLRRPDPQNAFNERIELEPKAKRAFRRYFDDISRSDKPDAG